MAKRNKVYIDVVIDDKGTTKKVALSQKQLGEAAAAAGNQVHNTDRRLKGAAQASSNTTKNFSKMAQGISGGLVPAYATLAASLFAVSAVFQFLKDAGNLETLQAGQVAYAGATGVAMRTLTQDIIRATDAQISFQDAASAASIGTAAGLSADTLTRLGEAAKSTSIILGRDVTDSFNRLVRGVTKAEPELLDELGIILRLDTAMGNYKEALNLGDVELNSFQRSQAVANEVLEQAESKFGRILAITSVAPNKFNKLGKAFDDILIQIKGVAAAVAGPFADVLIKSPELAGAAILLLVSGPLKAAIPGLQDMGQKTKDLAEISKKSFEDAEKSLERYKKSAKNFELLGTEGASGLKKAGASDASAILRAAGVSGKGKQSPLRKLKGDVTKITNEVALEMKRGALAGERAYGKMSRAARSDFLSAMDDIIAANDVAAGRVSTRWQMAHKTMELGVKKVEVVYKGVFASIRAAAAVTARAVGMVFNAIGWIGIIYTLYEVIKGFMDTKKEIAEVSEVLAIQEKRVESLVADYKDFAAIQKILSEDGGNIIATYRSFGNLANSLSNSVIKHFGKAFTGASESITQARETAEKDIERLKELRADAEQQQERSRQGLKFGPGTDMSFIKISRLTKEIEAAQAKLNSSAVQLLAETNPEKFKAFKDFLDIQINSFNMQEESLISNSVAANKYFTLLNNLRTAEVIDSKMITDLLQGRDAFVEVSKAIAEYDKVVKDADSAKASLINKLMPVSDAQKYLTALQGIGKAITALENDQDASNYDENDPRLKAIQERKAALVGEKRLVEGLIEFETAAAQDLLVERKRIKEQLIGADNITKTRLNTELKTFRNTQQQAKLQQDINTLMDPVLNTSEKLTEENEERVKALKIQIRLLQIDNELSEENLRIQERSNRINNITTEAEISKVQRQAAFLITSGKLLGIEKQIADQNKKKADLEAQISESSKRILQYTQDENGQKIELNNTEQQIVDKLRAQVAFYLAQINLIPQIINQIRRQNEVAELSTAQNIEKVKLLTRQKILEAGLTNGQKRRQAIIARQQQLQLEITQSIETEKDVRNAIAKSTVANVEQAERNLRTAQATRMEKQAELDILLRSTQAMEQYRLAIANGFESGLQKAINDLITGAESSFKDSLLNLTKSVFNTLAGKFSEIMADSMIDIISRSKIGSKIFRGMTLTDKVAEGHRQGAEALKTELNDTSQSMATTLNTSFKDGAAALAEAIREACASCVCDKANDTNVSEILDPTPRDPAESAARAGEAAAKPIEEATNAVKKVLNEETTFTETIKSSFDKFLQGAKGLGSKLGGFLKGFGGVISNFLKSFLSSLTGVASGGGSILSTVFSVVSSIFTGGGAPVPMANGGVVDKPTYALIGEGRYNEAVIPMPDGKRVPVELKDKRIGSNQNNNVTVNVSMSEGGGASTSTTENSGRDAAALGNIIAKAVQDELQNQKRSGGILNPYGAT